MLILKDATIFSPSVNLMRLLSLNNSVIKCVFALDSVFEVRVCGECFKLFLSSIVASF